MQMSQLVNALQQLIFRNRHPGALHDTAQSFFQLTVMVIRYDNDLARVGCYRQSLIWIRGAKNAVKIKSHNSRKPIVASSPYCCNKYQLGPCFPLVFFIVMRSQPKSVLDKSASGQSIPVTRQFNSRVVKATELKSNIRPKTLAVSSAVSFLPN